MTYVFRDHTVSIGVRNQLYKRETMLDRQVDLVKEQIISSAGILSTLMEMIHL